MVSKTRKTKMRKARKAASGDNTPRPADPKKSIHLKRTRPHLQHKHKIRLGMTSTDIYEGFEDRDGVNWRCKKCGRLGRTVGFCVACSVETADGGAAGGAGGAEGSAAAGKLRKAHPKDKVVVDKTKAAAAAAGAAKEPTA